MQQQHLIQIIFIHTYTMGDTGYRHLTEAASWIFGFIGSCSIISCSWYCSSVLAATCIYFDRRRYGTIIIPVKHHEHSTEKWMTAEILHLIRDQIRFPGSGPLQILQKHQKLCKIKLCKVANQNSTGKHKAKSEYYTHKVDEYKNQPKKLWETLKSLGASKAKSKSASIYSLWFKTTCMCFEKATVATTFNNFFTTTCIASSLIDKLPAEINQSINMIKSSQ